MRKDTEKRWFVEFLAAFRRWCFDNWGNRHHTARFDSGGDAICIVIERAAGSGMLKLKVGTLSCDEGYKEWSQTLGFFTRCELADVWEQLTGLPAETLSEAEYSMLEKLAVVLARRRVSANLPSEYRRHFGMNRLEMAQEVI